MDCKFDTYAQFLALVQHAYGNVFNRQTALNWAAELFPKVVAQQPGDARLAICAD